MNNKDDIEDRIILKRVSKGTVLQRPGDRKVQAFFVIKGLLRSYIIDSIGKEHTCMFASEEWIMADADLLNNRRSAILYIEALEDSEIEIFDEDVFNEIEKFSTSILSEEIFSLIKKVNLYQNRILMLMSSTAFERYQYFLKTHPDLTQRVSLKMIASYLGITPETLSVVRRKKKN